VSDRGTKGLGGPTRSDHTAAPGERNWLSFVLNSGEARDVDGGGGTYGYGKGVFFLASQVGTAIIYTRFLDRGTRHTRLIGSSLWQSFTHRTRPFTGRHWWGIPRDGHCDPLEDGAADGVARALGLPGFGGDDTGTTVVVVEPNLLDPAMPEEEAQQLPSREAGHFLAEAAAWNLWPLTVRGRDPRMRIGVTVDGSPIPVPDEDTDAVIAHFAQAYRQMRSVDGEDVWCKRPRRLLGRFGHERTFGAQTISPAAQDLGLEGAPHHVCLMREPELVVRYLPGPAASHPAIGYAAVLKVGADLDGTFSKAEPPTHDAWIDTQLHGAEATFVRVTHRRMKERLDEIAGARRSTLVVENHPVAGVARKLGHLLAAVAASGAATGGPSVLPAGSITARPSAGFGKLLGAGSEGPSGRAGGGSRRGPGRPRLNGSPRFVDGPDGTTTLEQRVHLPGRGSFVAAVHVVTGDGRLESDPYAGALVPRIRGWRTPDGHVGGPAVSTDAPCDAVLVIEPVADCALDISVVASG
jgi:hypothetical protein